MRPINHLKTICCRRRRFIFFRNELIFLDLRSENETKSWSLQVYCNSEEALQKIKPQTVFEPVPSRFLLNATISSPSRDHINLKIFFKKMLFRRTILPLSSNHFFAIYQKSDFNRSKSHLNLLFMEIFSLHKTTFFVATHTGDQLNFIATQPKSYDSYPPLRQ